MPKCLLSTVRRYRARPTVRRGDTEVTGGQGSREGSDNSDCSTGTCRPARSNQRRAVKRKRSLSHLSVVTRFYMHTEQSEEGAHQDKGGNNMATDHDSFTAPANCTSSFSKELVQTATQTKHTKHKSKSRLVKSKQLLTKRKDYKITPPKSIQKRNKDALQGWKLTTESCGDKGHFLHASSLQLKDNTQQWPGAVLQPPSCQQLSALPVMYTDLSKPQQCMPVTCTGPALLSAASQTTFDGLSSFTGSSADFTLGHVSLPLTVTSTSLGCMKDCDKDSEPVQTMERRMPYALTSGFLVASQLLPVAVVQPVWLQSIPMFISSCKTSPATNVFENHAVYQSVMAHSDCLQEQNKHLSCGVEVCPVSASQTWNNTVVAQPPVRATTYVCSSSGHKSPESQLGDCTGKAKEASLYTLTKQNALLAKEVSPQGYLQFPFTSADPSWTDTSGNSSTDKSTKIASSVIISASESYCQGNSETCAKDSATLGSDQSELQKPDSVGGILEQSLSTSERDHCSLTNQFSHSFVSNAGQSNFSLPHREKEMDCRSNEKNNHLYSTSSALLSNMHTQYLKFHRPNQCAFLKNYEPHCYGENSSPGKRIVSNQPFSTSAEVSEDNTNIKERFQPEVQSLTTADESWKICDNEKGFVDRQGIEIECKNFKNDTVTGRENVSKETIICVQENQNSCYASYQGRSIVQQDLSNTDVNKCKNITTADLCRSTTNFLDGKISIRASSSAKQMDSSTRKNEVPADVQDRSIKRVQSEVNMKKYDSIAQQQVSITYRHQEFKLPNISTGQQNSKVLGTEGFSTQTEQKRTYTDPSPGRRETDCSTYSSKWISAVAACISAQPSLYSDLYSPISAVVAPINHLTNGLHNPEMFSTASFTNVNRKPLASLSSLTNFSTGNWISGSAESTVTKRDCLRKNKENNPSLEPHGGYVSNRVASPRGKHAGTQADRNSDFCQDSVDDFFSSNTRRDEATATHSFGEVEEFGLRASSQKCLQCNMDFLTHTDLLFHMSVHEADKQGENGGGESQRMNKNDAETGESRNKCGVCSRVFTRSWLLKGHMRTHTGERPFRCTWPQCQRAFADKSNLRSHTLIHTTTAKSFTCPKCSRAFSQKRYLHKHMLEVCRII